jgi:phosphohistidine phosphatase SixA
MVLSLLFTPLDRPTGANATGRPQRSVAFQSGQALTVAEDSAVLAAALRRVLEPLPEGGRALAVGHSPTNEAAVLGLTGSSIEPMAKGAGVLVVAEGDEAHVEPLG